MIRNQCVFKANCEACLCTLLSLQVFKFELTLRHLFQIWREKDLWTYAVFPLLQNKQKLVLLILLLTLNFAFRLKCANLSSLSIFHSFVRLTIHKFIIPFKVGQNLYIFLHAIWEKFVLLFLSTSNFIFLPAIIQSNFLVNQANFAFHLIIPPSLYTQELLFPNMRSLIPVKTIFHFAHFAQAYLASFQTS